MLKKIAVALSCTLAAGFLAGCASTPKGEAFLKLAEPLDSHGLLYVYRQADDYGKALRFKLLIDGKEKGDLGTGAYMIIPVEPGKHSIEVKGLGYKDVPSEVEVPTGQLSFLKVVTKKGFGGFSATLSFESAIQSVAIDGLSGLKREPERFLTDAI